MALFGWRKVSKSQPKNSRTPVKLLKSCSVEAESGDTSRTSRITDTSRTVGNPESIHQQLKEHFEEKKEPISEKPTDPKPCPVDDIKERIRLLSEEVCTILSMISLLVNIEEGREMEDRVKRMDNEIQSLLGPLHYYMTESPPVTSSDFDMWTVDRKQCNKEFESMVNDFRSAQKLLRLEMVKLNSKKRF